MRITVRFQGVCRRVGFRAIVRACVALPLPVPSCPPPHAPSSPTLRRALRARRPLRLQPLRPLRPRPPLLHLRRHRLRRRRLPHPPSPPRPHPLTPRPLHPNNQHRHRALLLNNHPRLPLPSPRRALRAPLHPNRKRRPRQPRSCPNRTPLQPLERKTSAPPSSLRKHPILGKTGTQSPSNSRPAFPDVSTQRARAPGTKSEPVSASTELSGLR